MNQTLRSIAAKAVEIGGVLASPSALDDKFLMQSSLGEQAVLATDSSRSQRGRLTFYPKIELLPGA